MPVLSRFGRMFSAGFYAFIGVVGAQTLANIHRNSDLSSKVCANTVNYYCDTNKLFSAWR